MELSHSNQVITPDVWGPVIWDFLHQVTLAYPINPSHDQKTKYKAFFMLLKDVLPCSICAEHYRQNLTTMPLDNQVLESNSYLVKWLIDFHNIVNEMKEKPTINFLEAKKIMDDKKEKHNHWHNRISGRKNNELESNTLLAIRYFALGYSNNPTLEQKEKYKTFFNLIKDIMPCNKCRDEYVKRIPIDEQILKNRESLNKWFDNKESEIKIKEKEKEKENIVETFAQTNENKLDSITIIEKSYPNTLFYLLGILAALIIIALIYRKN